MSAGRQETQHGKRLEAVVSTHAEKVNFIWSVKEVLRDHYRRHQYQDVILPFCVLRRLDCVLERQAPSIRSSPT
jgi:type I restriction-modification system DNA methylase subunit